MKIKKITVQLDDGTVDHAFDHGVEAGYDLGTHVSNNFDFLLNSIGYRKQSEGEWRAETDEDEPNPLFKLCVCSVCNEKANNTYKFCPECGAKMKGDLYGQRETENYK